MSVASSVGAVETPLDPRIARRFHWASMLNGLAFGLEISALPLYFLSLDLPPALYGLLIGATWLVSLFVRIPIGALSLRLGNRRLMNIGCWTYAPLSWALVVAGSVPLFFAIRLLNGVARSLMVLPMRSWFTELCPRPRLATELGILSARFALGHSLLGLLGGPFLLWLIGPAGLLLLLGILPLVIWALLRPAPPDHPAASERAAAGQGRPGLLWIAAPCGIVASMASTASAAFMPLMVIELGWPTLAVGVLLFIQGTAAVLCARMNGAVVARWGERLVARTALVLIILASLLLYLVPGGIVLPIVALLSGMGAGSLPVIAMGLAARALPSRSRGISIHETYVSVGLGAGPFLGGLVIGFIATPRAALLACVVVAAIGLVLVTSRRGAVDAALAR